MSIAGFQVPLSHIRLNGRYLLTYAPSKDELRPVTFDGYHPESTTHRVSLGWANGMEYYLHIVAFIDRCYNCTEQKHRKKRNSV